MTRVAELLEGHAKARKCCCFSRYLIYIINILCKKEPIFIFFIFFFIKRIAVVAVAIIADAVGNEYVELVSTAVLPTKKRTPRACR